MAEQKQLLGAQLKQLGILTSIPILLFLGPVIGYFAGSWIDRKYQIFPWVTIILSVLGFIASGKEVARLIKEVSDLDEKTKNPRDKK